ncbi:hypothetical protein [Streptosporangium sp. NPDC001681]|uniref:hypothetical protein n=1 Tax=Streptosporangium sp. NPDC001681 TaxID=3154395 RepID=UPI00333020D1
MVSRHVEYNEKVSPEQLSAQIKRSAVLGLRKSAEAVLATARHNAPHESGDLERSGAPSVDASRLVAAVSFDTPYAVRQHEEMDYDHPKKGGAKYLEKALAEEAANVLKILAKHLEGAFR